MANVLVGVAGLVIVLALLVAAHFALIEIGREVVTLRTQREDGSWQQTRLWAVDDDGAVWLHSGGPNWLRRFDGDPIVELDRGSGAKRYRAHACPGPHPAVHTLLRQKYGIADRWVRFLSPDNETTVAVRLDPI